MIAKGIRVVILGEYIKIPPVESRAVVVELVDVGMLQPIHKHLGTQYNQKWTQNLSQVRDEINVVEGRQNR